MRKLRGFSCVNMDELPGNLCVIMDGETAVSCPLSAISFQQIERHDSARSALRQVFQRGEAAIQPCPSIGPLRMTAYQQRNMERIDERSGVCRDILIRWVNVLLIAVNFNASAYHGISPSLVSCSGFSTSVAMEASSGRTALS